MSELKLEDIKLCAGSMEEYGKSMCIMNTVAWLGKEPNCTDTPECACPIIARFAVEINDCDWTIAQRTKYMLPLATKIVNSRASEAVVKQRCERIKRFVDEVVIPYLLTMFSRFPKQAKARDLFRKVLAKEVGPLVFLKQYEVLNSYSLLTEYVAFLYNEEVDGDSIQDGDYEHYVGVLAEFIGKVWLFKDRTVQIKACELIVELCDIKDTEPLPFYKRKQIFW